MKLKIFGKDNVVGQFGPGRIKLGTKVFWKESCLTNRVIWSLHDRGVTEGIVLWFESHSDRYMCFYRLPWILRYCDSPFMVRFFVFNRLSETGTCTVLRNHFVMKVRLSQRSGKSSQWLYVLWGRSQCPRILRRGFAAARLLGLGVRVRSIHGCCTLWQLCVVR